VGDEDEFAGYVGMCGSRTTEINYDLLRNFRADTSYQFSDHAFDGLVI